MRKAITIMIIALLAMTLLVGCGKKDATPAETPKAPEAAAQSASPAPEPAKPAETAPAAAPKAEPAGAPVDLGVDSSDLDIGDNPDYGMDDDVDMTIEE